MPDLFPICFGFISDLFPICFGFISDLFPICFRQKKRKALNYDRYRDFVSVKNLLKICQKFVKNLSKICQKIVKKLSKR